MRCFDPSQGCSDSPVLPAQHDSVWMVGCFASGHASMQRQFDANCEAAAFKLIESSSAAHRAARARPAADQSRLAPMRSGRAPTCGVAAPCSLTGVSSTAIMAYCLSRGADAEHVGQLLRGDCPVSNEPAQVVQAGGQLLAVVSGGTALRNLQQQSQSTLQWRCTLAQCMSAADPR